MLSDAENQLLCRVGPGTTMGGLMREYWLPILLSSELPGADSAPLRVRLLGEDLVAFRDSAGLVGLVQNHCPHRGASLFFGRNEESGLRCVYHGWKFDVHGTCIDMPNEPAGSTFRNNVHAVSHPCRERNGIIWAYLGQSEPLPPLPDLEWNLVPECQVYVSKRLQYSNWLQSLEGAIDSSHANFLHAGLQTARPGLPPTAGLAYLAGDAHPVFERVETENGVMIAARRDADTDTYYWRVNHFMMPFYTVFPSFSADSPASGHAWVPVDDETTLVFHFSFHPTRSLAENELDVMRNGRDGQDGFHARAAALQPPTNEPHGAWKPQQISANDYWLDREVQRRVSFSGIPSGWAQDAAVQESMGAIYDRGQEHLGSSDAGIIAVRRFLLRAAQTPPSADAPAPGVGEPCLYRARACSALLPRGADWTEAMRAAIHSELGSPLAVV